MTSIFTAKYIADDETEREKGVTICVLMNESGVTAWSNGTYLTCCNSLNSIHLTAALHSQGLQTIASCWPHVISSAAAAFNVFLLIFPMLSSMYKIILGVHLEIKSDHSYNWSRSSENLKNALSNLLAKKKNYF